MQSGAEVDMDSRIKALSIWESASLAAIQHATQLDELGIHKSISNRLLEPFLHMTTLISGTNWDNFFALRAHEDAQPEFQVLAYRMLEQYLSSTPKQLEWGEWHLPFGDQIDESLPIETKCAVATARCARLSYLTYDGDHSVEKDMILHDRLKESGHWSPFEHLASADNWDIDGYKGNFTGGWTQYRKTFAHENRSADLQEIFNRRPERLK